MVIRAVVARLHDADDDDDDDAGDTGVTRDEAVVDERRKKGEGASSGSVWSGSE